MKQTFRQMIMSWVWYLLRDQGAESGVSVLNHGPKDNVVSFRYRGKTYQIEIKEVA